MSVLRDQEEIGDDVLVAGQVQPVATPTAALTTVSDSEDTKGTTVIGQEKTARASSSSRSNSYDIEQENKGTVPAEASTWSQKLNPLKWRKAPPIPKKREVSRENGAGILSNITFHWMAPLMRTGYLRRLELEDIWLVNPNRSAKVLSEKLQGAFDRHLETGDRHPLLWSMLDTFKVEFLIGGVCQLIASILVVLSPYTTRYLIKFATEAYVAQHSHQPGPDIGHGIGLAIGITCMQVLQSLNTSQFIFRGMMVGGQSRAVLTNLIFSKSMRLSNRAKAGGKTADVDGTKKTGAKTTPDIARDVAGDGTGWGNGRIITLMSVDADRVDTAAGMFHILWTAPISIIITLIVLCINIGYSALSGYALLLVGFPILTYAIKSLIRRRKSINKITDQRVTLTQEILQAVRFVKYFGWEGSFLERLKEIRRREIYAIQILLSIRNAIMCVSMALPVFASMLAFVTYSLSQHELDPAPVFSSLALFNSLRMPLNLLPLVLGQVTDAWTALGRIQDFLLAEEQQDPITWDKSMDNAVEADDASFTWERTPTKESGKPQKGQAPPPKADKQTQPGLEKDGETYVEPFKLSNVSFTAGRNELVAVIGTVGCGKSSLLAALAGDMRMTDGKLTMGAARAFCPQYAWIQNATVRDNIVFGKEYDKEWYNKVVDACALTADFDVLPAGDFTEIGERGITVSGGQKQRLNIARAIYFDADIVLMDDPLSAVDAHVGRHIMDNAICGLLKDKCRILATHQLHVLSRCDRIILMDEGKIESIDTFDNLMQHSETFKRLMATTAQEESTAKEEKGGEEEEEKIEEEVKEEAVKSKVSKQSGGLIQQEERAVDSVSWGVWGAYIRASGWILNAPLIVITLVLANGANIVTSLWLSYWTSHKFNLSQGQYIGIYAGLGGVQVILMYIFSTILTMCGTTASKTMLQRAMTRVLRAPVSFFDTTPLGRITNRFSKDINTMDNLLTDAMRIYYITITMVISVMILVIVFFHYFAVALVPLSIMFIIATDYYRTSARELKRFEAVLRSGVYSQFGEAVAGTASIRAYGLQDQFSRRIQDAIDQMNSAYFLTFSNQRWLSVRLDAVGNLMVLVTGILVVTSRFDVSPSISGLVLSYILAIVQILQFTIRQLAEVENNMNATERLHYYGTQLDEEAPLHLMQVESSWPQTGKITFSNVQMRYRDGLPLVLQGLNMEVRGGERIGIVGRTGAGKSSIMAALFRLTELSGGSIKIDDIDIAKVGLHDLRSRLAIIPQDPALFQGTIRSNLDPFNEHTDLELWGALRKAYLVGSDDGEKDGETGGERLRPQIHLDTVVNEEGLNFSLGQRQLMALARALVRDSRIIVCDEATSSVDFETDEKIQQTMAAGFEGKTLLCIAHRLRTIIHYDRICVMDKGQIAEMDQPLKLWEARGIFRSMCERSGITQSDFTLG